MAQSSFFKSLLQLEVLNNPQLMPDDIFCAKFAYLRTFQKKILNLEEVCDPTPAPKVWEKCETGGNFLKNGVIGGNRKL